MILSGVSGATDTVIQKSRLNSIPPLVVNFWTSIAITICPLGLSLVIEFDRLFFPTDPTEILLVLGQSFANALSLIFMVRGIAMCTAIWITLALSMQIVFLMVSQYTVLSTIAPGNNNWIEIFGAVIVFIAAVLPPIWESIEAKFVSKSPNENIPLNKGMSFGARA